MKKIKVLQVIPKFGITDGISHYLMNYYLHCDLSVLQIDFFLITEGDNKDFYNLVNENNGNIYILKNVKSEFLYTMNQIKEVMKNGNYDVVHCHVVNAAPPFLYYAKKYGVKVRIIHSHATKTADKKWKEVRNDLIKPLAFYLSNRYLACSKLAGDFLFGKRKYDILPVAIDLKPYLYNEALREKYRNKYNLKNKFVVASIGRLCLQKNPYFALKVIKSLIDIVPNTMFIWIGNGELLDDIKKEIDSLVLEKNVLLLGAIKNISEIYNAIDVILMPSLYEGLPQIGIEVQANGLGIIASDTVTREMDISGNVKFISLKEKPEIWAKTILSLFLDKKSNRNVDYFTKITEAGFNIQVESTRIIELYRGYLK